MSIAKVGSIDLYYDDELYAYLRQDSHETLVIVINRAAEKTIMIPAWLIGLREGEMLLPLHNTSRGATARQGGVELTVPAQTAVVYKVRA